MLREIEQAAMTALNLANPGIRVRNPQRRRRGVPDIARLAAAATPPSDRENCDDPLLVAALTNTLLAAVNGRIKGDRKRVRKNRHVSCASLLRDTRVANVLSRQ